MNPRQFLLIGGIILVLVGLLGFSVLGPTAEESIFGAAWWFDNGENWAHLVIGIVALLLLAASHSIQKPIVMLVGIIGILVGIYNIFQTNLLGANLEQPADLILHLVVGAWALWASMKREGGMMMQSPTA